MRRSRLERQAPLLLALLAGCASSSPQALLQDLNARLLSHDSATATLEQWCGLHHLAAQPVIHAQRIPGADAAADEVVRRELQVTAGDVLRYRHVRLECGSTVMSEAANWYVPSRLTPAMNAQLDTSDQPFGRVVQPLAYRRITRSVEMLWQPNLPPMPQTILRHRAVLVLGDGTPFSYVVESYQSGVLGRL